VITLGARTVEGAVQAGMGYAVFATVLTYLPQRFAGIEPILFAFGSVTYAVHPEGILEYQKGRWMKRVNRLFSAYDRRRAGGLPVEGEAASVDAAPLEVLPAASLSGEVLGG